MSSQWPPEGHNFSYRVEIQLDDHPNFHFDMTLPAMDGGSFDTSTVRLGRHGGANEADLAFRARLYSAVGAIAVAGGHVETAMKRLALHLKGESSRFSVVDKTWSDLHKILTAEGNRQTSLGVALKRDLKWAEENEIKRRRDDAIHANWWNYDGCGVIRSRFYRKEDGVQLLSSFDELEKDARLLFEYAGRLDRLLGEQWPRALLPAGGGDA